MRTAALIVFQTLLLFAMILCTNDIQLVWTEEVTGTVVRVIPEEIVLGSPVLEDVVGTTFTIAVVVENVTNLYLIELFFAWNTTYLEYGGSRTVTIPVDYYPDPIPPSPYPGLLLAPVFELMDRVFTNEGWYGLCFSSRPWLEFVGSGTAFIMTFKVKSQPVIYELPDEVDHVNFTFHWTRTELLNYDAEDIPHMSIDGKVKLYARLPSPDINNDGVVDIYDVVIAANAYGSRVGDLNWNQLADLCPEWGKIDLFDLVTLAYHYGETYP